MKRITFEVDEEIKNKITCERTKQGISEKDYMNNIITHYFNDSGGNIKLDKLLSYYEQEKNMIKIQKDDLNINDYISKINKFIDIIDINARLDVIKILKGEK